MRSATFSKIHAIALSLLLLIMGVSAMGGCTQEKVTLKVLMAGSLVVPFDDVEAEFEALYPNIDVQLEGHGSIQVVRHVTEIGDEVDVAVVADWSLIPMLMYETSLPEDEGEGVFADYTAQFATNSLGIAYKPDSAYADEINEDNWYDILSQSDVDLGLSDPRLDASGYRAMMLCLLAENYYGDSTIFEDVISNHLYSKVKVTQDGDASLITVPEILETTDDRTYLRGFSVQLIALLEAEQIDYFFLYESVALQQGFEFLPLPEQIDFSSAEYAGDYAKVSVELDFQRFASVEPVFTGQPIIYGLTIPNNSQHKEEAELFINFLLSAKGQEVMNRNNHLAMEVPVVDRRIPEAASFLSY